MLLCSDYDRTLRIDNQISGEVRKAIQAFRNAGHLFVINTGRTYGHMMEELRARDLECDYVIAGSGSQVFTMDGTMLHGNYFGEELSRKTAQVIIDAKSLNIVVGAEGQAIAHWRADCPVWDLSVVNVPFDRINAISTRFPTNEEAEVFARYLESVCEVNAYLNRNAVDIVPKGVSKATGVEILHERLGIARSEVFVIGDASNDLSMIRAFDGFCMDHSTDDIKQQSKRSFFDVAQCIDYLMQIAG